MESVATKITYYSDENGLLYSKSNRSEVYRLRSSTKQLLLSKEDFDKLITKQIKNQEFSRLMNLYFKNVKAKWIYDGYKMKKLPNFESNEYTLIENYDWKKLPKHDCGVYGQCLLVYHWGKVYYFTLSYGGYPQGQLLDIKTKSAVRWAKSKHCAPIKNLGTGLIM